MERAAGVVSQRRMYEAVGRRGRIRRVREDSHDEAPMSAVASPPALRTKSRPRRMRPEAVGDSPE